MNCNIKIAALFNSVNKKNNTVARVDNNGNFG